MTSPPPTPTRRYGNHTAAPSAAFLLKPKNVMHPKHKDKKNVSHSVTQSTRLLLRSVQGMDESAYTTVNTITEEWEALKIKQTRIWNGEQKV